MIDAGSAADERERIDLTTVLEDLEVHVRTGRAAGGTHESQRIASCHRAANADGPTERPPVGASAQRDNPTGKPPVENHKPVATAAADDDIPF